MFPHLFQDKNCNHDVTITLFSRTFYDATCIGEIDSVFHRSRAFELVRYCIGFIKKFLVYFICHITAAFPVSQRISPCICENVFRGTIRVASMKTFTGRFKCWQIKS